MIDELKIKVKDLTEKLTNLGESVNTMQTEQNLQSKLVTKFKTDNVQ